jgi:hypothetical protein
VKLGIATLAVSTVVLAASTVYFARELARERERNSAPHVESRPGAAAPGTTGQESDAATLPGGPVTPATGAISAPGDDAHADPAVGSSSVAERRSARNRQQAAEFLRRYDNPETRAKLLEDRVENLRRLYSELRPELDIDAGRFDRLIKLFAEQQLEDRVRVARCLTDTFCLNPNLADGAQRRQAVVDVIGEANTVKLEKYSRSSRPRSGEFDKLQARLGPKRALSDQQLNELSIALHDEWQRTRREVESHGHETGLFATSYGVIVYAKDTKTVEERMASAAASIDRMRDRAGTLLNGEKLTIFNQTQDDALLAFRPSARMMISAMELGFEAR